MELADDHQRQLSPADIFDAIERRALLAGRRTLAHMAHQARCGIRPITPELWAAFASVLGRGRHRAALERWYPRPPEATS